MCLSARIKTGWKVEFEKDSIGSNDLMAITLDVYAVPQKLGEILLKQSKLLLHSDPNT